MLTGNLWVNGIRPIIAYGGQDHDYVGRSLATVGGGGGVVCLFGLSNVPYTNNSLRVRIGT